METKQENTFAVDTKVTDITVIQDLNRPVSFVAHIDNGILGRRRMGWVTTIRLIIILLFNLIYTSFVLTKGLLMIQPLHTHVFKGDIIAFFLAASHSARVVALDSVTGGSKIASQSVSY